MVLHNGDEILSIATVRYMLSSLLLSFYRGLWNLLPISFIFVIFDFQDPWTKGCRDSSCCYTFPISPAGYVSTSFAGVGEGSVLGCALTCFSFAWKRDIFSIMDMNAAYFRLQLLTQMGIERLVLPAIPQLRETWETSFGFLEMTLSERLQFLGYPFLAFQGTIMLQKFLRNSMINKEMRGTTYGTFFITDKQLYTSILLLCFGILCCRFCRKIS